MAKLSRKHSEQKTLVVWHADKTPPTNDNTLVYCWNGYSECREYLSIPAYLEDNAERLRAKYLAFIYELGEAKINRKRIAEHLEVGKGYNLWWMSSLAEKNYINSPRITDCLKILALEEILHLHKPEYVHVYTNDNKVLHSIHALCTKLKIFCSRTRVRGHKKCHFRWWSFIPFRPKPLVAAWWLMQHIRSNWGLRQKKRPDWFADSNSVTLVSHFFHLVEEKCSRGEFYSAQWEKLPELFYQHGIKINWIHHFILSSVVSHTQKGKAWIKKFNQDPVLQGKHAFFDGYMNPLVILKVCFKYLRLLSRNFILWNASRAFRPKGSMANFWPLLKQEWLSSIRGATAMRNLLYIELVDLVLENLPKQNLCLYLQENLFWEHILINAWRRHGHGKIVGVAHATIRYFDLRYFYDPRTISNQTMVSKLLPDAVALNGSVARQNFIDAGYPVEWIVEVEALRYLHFTDYQARLAQKKMGDSLIENHDEKVKVIILGDISYDVTEKMLRCLEGALSQNNQISFTLKAHPAQPVNINNYDIPKLSETTLHLSDCLSQFSLSIAAGATSAALDAYLASLNVIVFLEGGELNLSPLRGFDGVTFVSTPSEMAAALAAHDPSEPQTRYQDFFWLDKDLPRWRKLIADSGFAQVLKNSEAQDQ